LSLYDGGDKDKWIRHIGFLGATPPAITGLQPQSFKDSDKYITFEFKGAAMSTDTATVSEKITETPEMILMERNWLLKLFDKFKVSAKDFAEVDKGMVPATGSNQSIDIKEAGTAGVNETESSSDAVNDRAKQRETKDPGPTATEKMRAAEAHNDAEEAENENTQLKKKVEALEDELEKLKALLAKTAGDSTKSFCEGLVAEGRLRPVDLEETIQSIKLREAQDKVKNFSEDSPESSVAKYKKYLSQQPKVVVFGDIIKNYSEKDQKEDLCNMKEAEIKKFVADKARDRMALTPNISYDSAYAWSMSELSRDNPKAYAKMMGPLGYSYKEKDEDDDNDE
jgi:hypothetical protein